MATPRALQLFGSLQRFIQRHARADHGDLVAGALAQDLQPGTGNFSSAVYSTGVFGREVRM